MFAIFQRILSYKFFPLCWTLLIVFLLCIPGSYVPGSGIFGMKHLDKLVHLFLFGFHVLFWGWHYQGGERSIKQLRNIYLVTVVLTIVLGVALEFVQLYFIPFRSFDDWDIVADSAGAAVAGSWLLKS